MKRKILGLCLLVFVLATVSGAAFESGDVASYGQLPMAIAWRENNEIYVALVNDTSYREMYTLEVYDTQRRANLVRAEISVPSKSVLIEKLNPKETGKARFPIEEVTIYSGYRSRTIKIQDHPYFKTGDYIVPANTNIAVEVDFVGLQGNSRAGRLEVDSVYTLYSSNRTGAIDVEFEGGYSFRWRTIIDYRPPHMKLTMRTPFIYGVDLLTFGITHEPEGTWISNYVYGPVLLVYGSDYRVIDNTGSPASSSSSSPASQAGQR